MATTVLRSGGSSNVALAALVNPYVVSVAAIGVIGVLSASGHLSFGHLLVLAGVLAGWSSAWSP
jgi:hypothetical protein